MEVEILEEDLTRGKGFHNREYITMCLNVANNFTKYRDIKTVIDFGAGTGVYSKAFHTLGYQVLAIEDSQSHREYMERNASAVPVYSIEEWMEAGPTDTDLLVWLAVENIDTEDIDMVFELIYSKYILFSSEAKTMAEWYQIFKVKGYRMVEEPGGNKLKVFKKI
jgi:hypothetical protein